MPFTPYHFGPSGFISLALRKWIDIPVFLLANVIVDLEVLVIRLLSAGWPIHRYTHTLLLGTAAGIIWAMAAWPMRNIFKKIMQMLRIPYEPTLWKMLVSGILGVWLHVSIDSIYHWDVHLFWPSKIKPLYDLVTKQQVQTICLVLLIPAFILYTLTVILSWKKIGAEKAAEKERRQ